MASSGKDNGLIELERLATESPSKVPVWELNLSAVRAHLVGHEESFQKAVDRHGPTRVAELLTKIICPVTRFTVTRICKEINENGFIKVPGNSGADLRDSVDADSSLQEGTEDTRERSLYKEGDNEEKQPMGESLKSEKLAYEASSQKVEGSGSGIRGKRRPVLDTGKKKADIDAGAVSDEEQQRIVAKRLQLKERDS